MSKLRLLVISPYEGMRQIISHLSNEFQNIDMTVLVGDLKKGVEIAQSNFHENYDAIISRGGTARLVRESVSIPVIEIKTSAYDILRTLKLANANMKKTAIIGFPQITGESLFLKEVLPYSFDIFTINSTEEAVTTLHKLMADGYQALLCDMITYTIAREIGFDAFLITSGVESIHSAISTALQYCDYQQQLRNENQFFRQLVKSREIRTAVYTADKKLFYSTVSDAESFILTALYDMIDDIPQGEKQKIMHRADGLLYSISAQWFTLENAPYLAFYYRVSKPPLGNTKYGILFYNRKQAEADYSKSLFAIANAAAPFYSTIESLNNDLCPVMITGEDGTGKAQLAKAIYLRSARTNQPFIQIDCILVSEKIWDFLMNSHNSPLCDVGNTLFFKNLNALTPLQHKQLLIALTEMEVCRHNKVIISYSADEGSRTILMEYMNRMHFFTMEMPALRDHLENLDSVINLYLNQINIERENQILGISEEALHMMQNYRWPYNYTQLARVLNALMVTAPHAVINSSDVKDALDHEISITTASANRLSKPLDLALPLSEITREIALIVLDSYEQNHKKAAASLGISRTTLWRLLHDQKSE